MNNNKELQGISKQKYLVAGLKVGMILRSGGIIETQAKSYLADFEGTPEIVVGLDDKYIGSRHAQHPHLSVFECEYMWTGEQFCTKLLNFNGFMLHASAVVYEGRAYLFSAPSGTGKSTHTGIWRKAFGEENTYILNDDKPVIRVVNDEIIVYGTPWSGKTDQNRNIGVPLQGICFLERAKENWIEAVSPKEATFKILNQTIRPESPEYMSALLGVLDKLLTKTTVFRMGCNMELEAAKVAYHGMNGNLKGE